MELLSIVIPTRDRPAQLETAIESALGQTLGQLEVVVVDDGSRSPVAVPSHPRLRIVRQERGGTAAARNAGLEAARGRWITCLDDDDRLLPRMAETVLEALERTTLPAPVGLISGLEVVDAANRVLERRLPPTRPNGSHFALEPLEPGLSYSTKQTLVLERSTLLTLGGWDESFRSFVNQELFLRLNPVCSLLGLAEVTYHHVQHDGYRLSRDPELLQESFARLERKHHAALAAHPLGHAELLLGQARKLSALGCDEAAGAAEARARGIQAACVGSPAAPANGASLRGGAPASSTGQDSTGPAGDGARAARPTEAYL